MTDLEERLRGLATSVDPGPPTPVAELRARARRRRSRRRIGVIAAAVVVVLVVAAAGAVRSSDDTGQQVVAGPPTSADHRSLGNAPGVSLEVSPATGLVDGQQVDVHIDGLAMLPGARLVMCRGDVEQATAPQLCDLNAIAFDPGRPTLPDERITVTRFLSVPGLAGESSRVDCANEPAGCVIGLGNPGKLPVSGVIAPIGFAPAPRATGPVIAVAPPPGLSNGADATIEIRGLRANRPYAVAQCTFEGRDCSGHLPGIVNPTVNSDADGTLRATVRVWAVLYEESQAYDCTQKLCTIGVSDMALGGSSNTYAGHVGLPLEFAPDAAPPPPALRITQAGPYAAAGQTVTVTGAGFQPATNVAWGLAVCPTGEGASETRCAYPLAFGNAPAGDDGRFSIPIAVSSTIPAGDCRTLPQGCTLVWSLPAGSVVASAPLTFR